MPFRVRVTRCIDTNTLPAPALRAAIPPAPLLLTIVSVTNTPIPAAVFRLIFMPFWVKPNIVQFSMCSARPDRNWTPFRPPLGVPARPLILRFRKVTTAVAGAETTIPLVPATSTDATWPPPPSIVMAFVIVTAPKPPGSRALISPPAAVLEIAPAKVLQGAVRLHGLASSPTPETHVRVAWALAVGTAKAKDAAARTIRRSLSPVIGPPRWPNRRGYGVPASHVANAAWRLGPLGTTRKSDVVGAGAVSLSVRSGSPPLAH